MINYLEKYNNLPKDLRDKISAPHVMSAIRDMESRYSVNLAGIVMRVVVKDLKISELQNFFVYTVGITSEKAEGVVKELKEKVFSEVSNYIDYISNNEDTDEEKASLDNVPGLKTENNENEIKIEKNSVGADFYFSIEDEEEVRSQARDFSALDKREHIAKQVETKINNIMGEINVIFSSEDMLKRLKRVLQTYLRGVRDKVDTKLALKRKVENGGLGLDEEISDDILKVIDVINKDEKEHPGRIVKPREFILPEDKQNEIEKQSSASSFGSDAMYDFDKLKKENQNGNKETKDTIVIDSNKSDDNMDEKDFTNSLKEKEETAELTKKEKEIIEKKETAFIESNSDKKEEKQNKEEDGLVLDLKDSSNKKNSEDEKRDSEEASDVKKEDGDSELDEDKDDDIFGSGMIAKARNKKNISINNQDTTTKQFGDMSGKVKMEDIKKVSKLGGPLEELGSMDLVDFRRISNDAGEAALKILTMFELLEEDGFGKRMEGIKAWRSSPINKLYLSLGQESIVKKKDVKNIIEIRKKEKKEYLSQKEFDAIMELNAKLRY